jgi:hypothetical protein
MPPVGRALAVRHYKCAAHCLERALILVWVRCPEVEKDLELLRKAVVQIRSCNAARKEVCDVQEPTFTID